MGEEDRRRYPRVATFNLISYVTLDEDGTETGQGMGKTVNISQGGVLITTVRQLDSPKIVITALDLNGKMISIRGKIIRSAKAPSGEYATGISFEGSREEIIQAVKSLIMVYHSQKTKN